MSYTVKFCPDKGVPHTINYDDGTAIGLHRRGSQITLPIGLDEWQTLSMADSLQVIFTTDEKLDTVIDKLIKLKELKQKHNQTTVTAEF